ncbi:MAG: tRNA pseudouridine(13) synthase TruD [Candidatus Altiarchaeales archaeon HGW-Altiarchaeales-3]|nr:MAG: tRNA pseudouridine(13) synthase TruD [Candidatus Altiarchaeales archaeon HGW-Altiarchaeales-3]
MKLRQVVDDFKVEELSDFKVSDSGKYKLYLLEKRSMESFALLGYLSRSNNIPVSGFGIAGLKDKHAVTRQYLTVPSRYEIKNPAEKNFNLNFIGFVDKAIEIGNLTGNRFEITARDIQKDELQSMNKKAGSVNAIGIPNYFDSQRFESVVKNKFIVKSILKKEYEEAVKIFLTRYARHESSKSKEEKRFIAENWSSLKNLNIKNPLFAKIVNEYRKTDSWLLVYKKIPLNLREIFTSAYQSYLWNECVKDVLRQTIDKKNLYGVEYAPGELIFYKNVSSDELKDIPATFKTISHDIKPSEFEEKIIDGVLSREGIGIEEFNIKKETENFFKVYERNVIVKPADFSMSLLGIDELNDKGKNNKFKVTLSFTLPRGSYATLITKRMFNS